MFLNKRGHCVQKSLIGWSHSCGMTISKNADNQTSTWVGEGFQQKTPVLGYSTSQKTKNVLNVTADTLIKVADGTELEGLYLDHKKKALAE